MSFYPAKLLLSLTVHVAFWLGRCLPCGPRSLMDLTGEADCHFVQLVSICVDRMASSKLLMHWIPIRIPDPNNLFDPVSIH